MEHWGRKNSNEGVGGGEKSPQLERLGLGPHGGAQGTQADPGGRTESGREGRAWDPRVVGKGTWRPGKSGHYWPRRRRRVAGCHQIPRGISTLDCPYP